MDRPSDRVASCPPLPHQRRHRHRHRQITAMLTKVASHPKVVEWNDAHAAPKSEAAK